MSAPSEDMEGTEVRPSGCTDGEDGEVRIPRPRTDPEVLLRRSEESLHRIKLAHQLQVREHPIDRGYVDQLMLTYQNGIVVPALEAVEIVAPRVPPEDEHPVDKLSPGSIFLVDGFHRFQAIWDLCTTDAWMVHPETKERVQAREYFAVLPIGITEATPREALWLATTANVGQGRALEPSDFHKVLGAFLANGLHRREDGTVMSSREIHAALGLPVTDRAVRKWLAKLYPSYNDEIKRSNGNEGEKDEEEGISEEDLRAARKAATARRQVRTTIGEMAKTLADVARGHLSEADALDLILDHTTKLNRAAAKARTGTLKTTPAGTSRGPWRGKGRRG